MKKRVRLAAWMLTPIVVSVGAFLAGWLGAAVGGRLTWLVVAGLVGGLVAVVGWTILVSYAQKRKSGERSEDS